MIREILSILFPYIVLLYLTDSIQFVNKSHLLFVSYIGRKYFLKKSGLYISKLPPVGVTFLSHNIPVYFTAHGLYKIDDKGACDEINCEADDYHFIPYKHINTVEVDGKEVKLNEKPYIKAPSSIIANGIKDRINTFRIVKPSKRIKSVKQLFEDTFDIYTITSLNRRYSRNINYIQLLSLFLFINTFIILPAVLYTNIYLYIHINLVVINIILSYLIILCMTFYVHKRIYRTEKKPRLYALLSMICMPVSAMHATHYITADMYANYNYLAVAKSLLPSNIFINIIRKELHLIEHGRRMVDHSDLREYWGLKEKFITNLVEKSDITTNGVLTVPRKQDENATCYCPICLAEYITNNGKCSDCRVELEIYLGSQ